MKPRKILVVDDEPMVLSVHCAFLERMGHDVVACTESRDALRIYQQHQGRFDMLVTDFKMPALNGLQLTQRLRLSDASLAVVMITGFPEEIDEEELRQHDISCLAKPLLYDRLYEQMHVMPER